MIQRIYRGFRSRGIRYYPTFFPRPSPALLGGRPHSDILLTAQATAVSRMGVFRDPVYPTQRPPLGQRWRGIRGVPGSRRTIIRFCNTGEEKYTVQWISPYLTSPDRLDNPANIVGGQMGQPLITYAGHWFWIENITTGVGKAIRINRGSSWTGQQRTIASWIFDLNTGICLDHEKYLILVRHLLHAVKTRIRFGVAWADYDEDNTRIAIAMSLDQNHVVPRIVGRLTDDVPDYDIESMFNAVENEPPPQPPPCPFDDEFAVIQAAYLHTAFDHSSTTTIQHRHLRVGVGLLPHHSYSSHGITRSTSPEEDGF